MAMLNNQRVFHRELQVLFGWILRYFISGQTQSWWKYAWRFQRCFIFLSSNLLVTPINSNIFREFGEKPNNLKKLCFCSQFQSSLLCRESEPYYKETLISCWMYTEFKLVFKLRYTQGRSRSDDPPIEPRGLNITGWSVGLWCAWLLGDNP